MMRHICVFLFSMLCLVAVPSKIVFGAKVSDLGVAGVPIELGKFGDYDRAFAQLNRAGISVYFPTSQYVEQPSAKALGTESDFLAPCSATAPAFKALRRHKIRLLIAGELLYPRGEAFPSMDVDPLRQIIECAGRENIYGVLSYDEPVSAAASIDDVSNLYMRVNDIDPTLPVLMVHAPVVLDKPEFASPSAQAAYLEQVAGYSVFADVVGFDVYPIVKEIALIGSPYQHAKVMDHVDAVRHHVNWLREKLPDHGTMLVLQGFSFQDLYDPDFLKTVAPQETTDAVRAPTLDELFEMAQASLAGGANLIMWWGLSFQKDEQSAVWRNVLTTAKKLSAPR